MAHDLVADGIYKSLQLVRQKNAEMQKALEAYEQWEADLIGNTDAWYTREREPRDLPVISQPMWDRLLEIQAMRNAALGRFN